MDPAALASAVVSVLGPYVTKGVEEFTKAAGEAAFQKAKQLFATLKTRWVGDAAAADQLARFEKKPEVYAPTLKDILEENIQQDSQLAGQLEQTVKQMGPSLQIILKMAQAEDVTALKAKEFTTGKANIQMNVNLNPA